MAAAAPQAVPSRMQLLESEKSCVPYARRPEWADVSPLPPPPGDAGKVVAIQYSERHAEALAYFRAVLAKVKGARGRLLPPARHQVPVARGVWMQGARLTGPGPLLSVVNCTPPGPPRPHPEPRLTNPVRPCPLVLYRRQGEKSARALDLTRHLIAFNSADYTAWEWRWECVVALGGDLAEESALTE
jgi:hypothetical protein